MNLIDIQQRHAALGIGQIPAPVLLRARERQAGPARTTETGWRATPENAIKYLYRTMWVDADVRASILDIREMDRLDGRVKKIHARTARTAIKGGLLLNIGSTNKKLISAWRDYSRRLKLDRPEKLESDFRGCMMEGNLPLQWIIGEDRHVHAAVRMPTETLLPVVGADGRFKDPARAYEQYDLGSGAVLARFALWQLSLVRLTPDNHDDMGSMGRPYLDASRATWKKLRMTEEDLVIRRRERAPLRTAHVLEGATDADLLDYKARVEDDQKELTTNYYLNRKGSVSAIQGDANLDQIADVNYLLDTFYAGSPAPKGLFGYSGELNRDILEDLKRDYFDEVDALQDTVSHAYRLGFELDLLLQGVDPDDHDFDVQFAERRTDTPNQRADLALKKQAMGYPRELVWAAAGDDPAQVREHLEAQAKEGDPYPDPDRIGIPAGRLKGPRVAITPGNGRKGESAASISQ